MGRRSRMPASLECLVLLATRVTRACVRGLHFI